MLNLHINSKNFNYEGKFFKKNLSLGSPTDKKEKKFSSYIRKFRWEQLQSIDEEELPNTVYEEMRKYLGGS